MRYERQRAHVNDYEESLPYLIPLKQGRESYPSLEVRGRQKELQANGGLIREDKNGIRISFHPRKELLQASVTLLEQATAE